MAGHLFVIKGDLKKLECDAWALPTDEHGWITASFANAVGRTGEGPVDHPAEQGWITAPFTDRDDERTWLLNIGGYASTPPEHYAERAAEFVRQASSKLGAKRKSDRGKPLVAVNLVGTGAGGHGDEKGSVVRKLVPALAAVAAEEGTDCDVVLVAYDEGAYSAAQRVRREKLSRPRAHEWEELDDNAIDAARRLAAHARRNRLVLFLGSGISAGAGLPGWADLLTSLAKAYGMDEGQIERLKTFDFRDQAEILNSWPGGEKSDLNAKVAELLGAQERYSLAHGLLASLPVSESITTNFDMLFEAACRAWDGGRISVLPYEPAEAGSPWLLKLHGSVHAKDSITLTRADYRNLAERYGALLGLVQAMLFTRHMLFVGYSLSDEDFHEVVRQVRFAHANSANGHRERFGTVIALSNNPLFDMLWPDMSVVSLESPNAAQAASSTAARRFEIFLDRLCLEASDLDRHLLDSTYRNMLDDAEQSLSDALRLLQEGIASVPASPSKEKIEALLRHFGGPGSQT